jgi:hypothetical protein
LPLLAELRFAPVVPEREPLLERDDVAAFERDELLRAVPPPERDEPLALVCPLAPFVERFRLCPLREVDLLLLAIPNPLSSQVTPSIRIYPP